MKMIFALVALFTVAAHADQCQWNSSSDATSAVQLIQLHKDVMHYCVGCGDGKPSFISHIDDAQTRQASMGGQKEPYRTVVLKSGGETTEVDLAYLYVRVASDNFANLAHLVGCPSVDMPTFIKTSNRNSKELYYFDAKGQRQSVSTSTAMIGTAFPGDRKPASKK